MSKNTSATIPDKRGLFVTEDGKNLMFTFILVSSLFLLWGVCNGMIDVMDKHFQDELSLTKSQSAWVQFAHYLGYFLMAMPAGWLASKLGYKGGIITGLLMVAAGGFWFLPATRINAMAHAGTVTLGAAFIGYLGGVCTIAAGLTFLETVANPYTTVLGPQRYAATRINLAQSCNGVGWICGPIIGSLFFYSKDAAGHSTGSETLYIPYVIVAGVVLALSVVFYFANVPDIKAEDDYHLDEKDAAAGNSAGPDRQVNRLQVYVLLLLNTMVVIGIFGMILWLIVSACDIGQHLVGLASQIPHSSGMKITAGNSLLVVICAAASLLAAIAVVGLVPAAARISHHSMWSHPHFSAATLAQFLYVAAQAGIFSFLINYMTEDAPAIPPRVSTAFSNVLQRLPLRATWREEMTNWIGVKTRVIRDDIKDLPSLADKLKRKPDAVSAFLGSQLSDETVQALADYKDSTSDPKPLLSALAQDLNKIVKLDPKNGKKQELLYNAQRFSAVSLGETTRQLLPNAEGENLARLNRLLLADAYPGVLAYSDGVLGISDKGAAILASFGFVCFLIGRFTGAGLLRKFSAHRILGLYGLMNVAACFLVFLKLGWLSVACVFLSYFFMSIMFPTIFALGIFGLGARAKKASAYIVMAIMGGAVLPKLMGYVADQHDMSRSFIVPMICFVFVALYGFYWPKLSNAESL
ncbi:MAG: MFS transporter [Thermoguttaceae bacterium]|jgi:fucose permease